MLKEHVSWRRWAVILVGFLGTLLVVHPGSGDFNLGALAALACAFVYALYQVSTRMVREAEPIVTLLFGGLVGMVVISLAAPLFWRWPTPSGWAILVLIGLLGAVGHLCMIMALQRGEASRISPYTYAQLLWATLSGLLVFGDVPNALTLAGAAVIVACGLYIRRLDRAERRYVSSGAAAETSRR